VYLPIESTFKVINTGTEELHAALCGTPSPTNYEPLMVQPNEVWARAVGQDNWHREVHDIVVKNAEGRVHRIIVGETFNDPGNWSSYPPHKHDHFEQGVEANMEEVYYYRLNPAQGFGVQSIYTNDGSRNEAYRVQDGDTFLVPGGYHPVCAGGGYRLYYLWMMAGETDRVMIPHDDPNHQWLKG
jgi:5-deoxy-glucuronate isomerase